MQDGRTHFDTHEWTRAARRAMASDLPHRLTRRGNVVTVPSQRGRDTYRVSLTGGLVGQCSCVAAQHGKACAHVAATAIRLYEREAGVRVVAIKAIDAGQLARYLRGEGW